MLSSKSSILVDFAGAASVVYLSVWTYEFANWFSLTVVGANPRLVMAGLLPGGVIGVITSPSALALAKPLQTIVATSLVGLSLASLRKRHLPATKFALLCAASIYFGSVYWELLSMLSFIPMVFHEAAFLGLSFATLNFLLLAQRRLHLRNRALRSDIRLLWPDPTSFS